MTKHVCCTVLRFRIVLSLGQGITHVRMQRRWRNLDSFRSVCLFGTFWCLNILEYEMRIATMRSGFSRRRFMCIYIRITFRTKQLLIYCFTNSIFTSSSDRKLISLSIKGQYAGNFFRDTLILS